MLITEELHLLLTRPDGRAVHGSIARGSAEVATLIVDLVVAGVAQVDDGKQPRVRFVADAPPPEDPVLRAGLERMRRYDGQLFSVFVRMGAALDPTNDVVDALIAAGVLEKGGKGFLGLGSHRTPESDAAPEAALRARLAAVLDGTTQPTLGDTTILTVLDAMSVAEAVLADESGGRSARDLRTRIRALAKRSPAGEAVSEAVMGAVLAAVAGAVAAITAATVVVITT